MICLLLLLLVISLPIFRRLIQQHPQTSFPNSTHWRSKQKMISHARSHCSQAYKVTTPSVLYDKIRQLEAGSNITILWRIQSVRFIFDSAKSAIANLNLLVIKLQVTGALFFELIPMAIISSSDFNLMGLTQRQDNLQPSSSPSSLGTTTVSYDGHFLKLFILASGTSWTHSMRGRKLFNPHKNPRSNDQHLLSRMTHSPLPSTNTSHILNYSAKLMDML